MPPERLRGMSIVWRSAITGLLVFASIGIGILTDTLPLSLGIGLLVLSVLVLQLMIGTTRTLRRQNQQLGELLEREQETVAELRELDRLKSDFAAAASHELRTPLTTIRGYAELLLDRGGHAELLQDRAETADLVTRDAIDAIARQTAHLQRLVGNLLREAQLEHGDATLAEETTSVAVVLEEVRRGFPGALDRIRLRIEPDLPSVALDPIALHEIVANLVDNALKYSAPGSAVDVDARIEGDALVIEVRDEGQGIPSGDLPRIFDRFTQIDGSSTRAHGGVGLGLHLVRELTRRAGGGIDVDSELGRGSTFTVRIPLGPGAPDRDARRPEVTTA